MFKRKHCKQCGWELPFFTKKNFCTEDCFLTYRNMGNRLAKRRERPFIIKSEIQGSEGRIVTYDFRLFGKRCYVSISDTKWHLDDKYKRQPIWWSSDDGFPSLYLWNVALFYDNRKDEPDEKQHLARRQSPAKAVQVERSGGIWHRPDR